MVGASVVIPCYKRVAQTLRTIELLLSSDGWGSAYEGEIIVADSSPDETLHDELTQKFGTRIVYVRPETPGIASNKNRGVKEARFPILIFCDSDMEVELDTLTKSIVYLTSHPIVAGLGGTVLWKGGPNDGKNDRPRSEDRITLVDTTSYVEALYSRYFVTYKDIFMALSGYDENVFLHRGEGSDLSCRYWRMGYPLGYEKSIVVHHVWDAPDAKAVRVSTTYRDIAKDFILLSYKYDMINGLYENFQKTIIANFSPLGDLGYIEIIRGVLSHFDFITEMKPKIDEFRKKEKPLYKFPFLEVFSQKDMFIDCITTAQSRLDSVRKGMEK